MTAFLRQYWPWLVAVVVALLVIRALLHRAVPPAPVSPAVQIATVREGTLLVRVAAHGRVGPPPGSTASLAFPISGRLQSIDVRVGDRVKTGQALAQLDAQPFALAVQQAQGDADAARGTLQSTASSVGVRLAEASVQSHQADLKVHADELALQRVQALYDAGIAALKDLQSARTQLSADESDARAAHVREQALRSGVASAAGSGSSQARADVLTARGQAEHALAALADAQRNLSNTTLRAPADGIVVAILKHPGESADASTPVLNLGSALERAATLVLPADQARRVHIGDAVQLGVARSAQRYTGKVIALVPAVDPTTQTATVEVSGVPQSAFAGDAVDATIVVATERGLLVPASSLVQDPQSGDTLVFVAQTDKDGRQTFQPRSVKVASSDTTTAHIAQGVTAGEKVAAEGAFELLAPAPAGD